MVWSKEETIGRDEMRRIRVGTWRKMVVVGYTRNDIELWTEVMARGVSFECHEMRDIKDSIGITVKVTLVAPGTIPRSEGKAKRVEDRRPKAL